MENSIGFNWPKFMNFVPDGVPVPRSKLRDGKKLAPFYPELADWPPELIAETFNLYCTSEDKDYPQQVDSHTRDDEFIGYIQKLAEFI